MTTSRSTASRSDGPRRAGAHAVLARVAWLGALLVAAWLLVQPSVAEARRRLVVLELDGDQAEDFQDELEKFLKKSHSVVPRKKWLATAEDLSAAKVTDKNVKKVAKELSIDGVISGTVEKRGSRYYVRLQLRDGTTGKTVTTTELVERAARFSAEGKSTLTDELLGAIDELDSAGDDGGDEEVDDGGGFGKGKTTRGTGRGADDDADEERLTAKEKAARAKAAKAARDKAAKEKAARDKRRRDRDDDEELADEDADGGRGRSRDRVADRDEGGDDEDPLDDEDDIELEGDGDDLDAAIDPRTRPFDLAAGLSFTARRLSFDTTLAPEQQPLGYKSNPVPGVTIAGDLFPLAFNRKNKSITRNLGITFAFDRVIKIESQFKDGDGVVQTLATTEQNLGIGVIYRHLVGAKLTVTAGIRYNKRKFVIDRDSVAPETVDIPDVEYTYVDPGVGVRYVLGPKMALGADARFLLISDTGGMQAMDQYGGATVNGIDVGGRFDYQLKPKLLIRGMVGLTRIAFSFKGNGELSNNRDMDPTTTDVKGATDLYFGGALTGVYLF